MTPDKPGVLEQERQRKKRWAELGVPDPIDVLTEESMTRRVADRQNWRHPARPVLDAWFIDHPDDEPHNWKD
jgi:hypothetical protein